MNKTVRFEVDYDDVTLRVSALRCVNDSGQDAYGELVRASDQAARGLTIPAGTTREVAIPQNPAAARFVFTLREGHVSGITLQSRWPA